nr:hypothetical protein CFP56_23288 [Quercus suber]
MGFPMEEMEVSDLAKEMTNLASPAAEDTDFLGPVVVEETNGKANGGRGDGLGRARGGCGDRFEGDSGG